MVRDRWGWSGIGGDGPGWVGMVRDILRWFSISGDSSGSVGIGLRDGGDGVV